MVIGLTGGIGCGKSSAAVEFGLMGFRLIDTDVIVKTDVLSDAGVVSEAVKRWGAGILTGGGQLDRSKVAEIIFSSPEERIWWEGVVHPRVGAIWRKRVADEVGAMWVVEIPLLFEARLEKGFDFVVCVGANSEVQLARAMARGMTRAQVCQRIASQLPLATKLSSAHAIIWNDGDRSFLRAQVRGLAANLGVR